MGFPPPGSMEIDEKSRTILGVQPAYPTLIECPNESNMNIFVADYGRQSAKICPLPSLYVFYSSQLYCQTIKDYFRSLVEK